MGRRGGGENRNANKVRKSVPKQWDPQGSSKELSFGEQGNDSTLPMGPLGEFFKELSFGE